MKKLIEKLKKWFEDLMARRGDAPPDGTPPSVTPPAPITGEWKRDTVYKKEAPWGPTFIQSRNGGILLGLFNSVGKNHSKILFIDAAGKAKELKDGEGIESYHQHIPHTIDGRDYIAAELGDRCLIYDEEKNQISSGVKKPSGDYRYTIANGWSEKYKEPVMVGHGKNQGIALIGMKSGKILHNFRGLGKAGGGPIGVGSAVTESPDGEIFVAVSWDEWGVYSDRGTGYKEIQPCALRWSGGRLYMGSMADGRFYVRNNNQWDLIHDFKCSKIHSLVEDGWGNLLIGGGNPDTFAVYDTSAGTIEIVDRFDDEKQEYNGYQFDAVVAPTDNPHVVIGARHVGIKGSTEVYEWTLSA